MKQQLFTYRHSQVSYYRFGTGKKVLVAFHGYDQTGEGYHYFEEELAQHFTVIAVDFFWHGRSEWNEPTDFTEADLKQLAIGIARQENIRIKKFSVCSFSMGARMARALVRAFPNRIEQLILLSPPTFSFNRFLDFTTRNFFGLAMFRYFVRNHGSLMRWVKRLNKAKLLNRSVYVFSAKFIGRPERLEKVFKTWYAQRMLQTDFSKFAQLLDSHGIRVVLIAGKKDTITPPHKMIRYVRRLRNGKVFLVHKKHELGTPETKRVFGKLFGTA